MDQNEAIAQFYLKNLSGVQVEKTHLTADCPFCHEKGFSPHGRLVVFLKRGGFFHGYFRCLNRCVPGGFPLWFARLSGLDPAGVVGFDPDREPFLKNTDFPAANLNKEIQSYREGMTSSLAARFHEAGVEKDVLVEQGIGFNGRYLVYPYFQDDGNC